MSVSECECDLLLNELSSVVIKSSLGLVQLVLECLLTSYVRQALVLGLLTLVSLLTLRQSTSLFLPHEPLQHLTVLSRQLTRPTLTTNRQ